MINLQSAFTLMRVGSALVQGKGERSLQRAQQGAEKVVNQQREKVRAAGNVRAAAQADLARAAQSVGNRRMRIQATRREAAARAAVLAQRDADSAGTFEGRIRASEAAGALAAEASVAGVAGGTFDLIAGTQALQQARKEFGAARAARARDYGLEVDSADAARTAVTGLDNATVFATLDRAVSTTRSPNVQGHWTTDILGAAKPDRLMALAEDIQTQAMPYIRRLIPNQDDSLAGAPLYRGDEGDY